MARPVRRVPVYRAWRSWRPARGWPAPSYSAVYGIVRGGDPGLLTLAHDGHERYRDRYELVYRRQAEAGGGRIAACHFAGKPVAR